MEHLSVTVEESTLERIDELKEERDESRSQVVRDLLSKGQRADELEKELNTLRERLESREERIQELEEQLARRSNIEEKVDTLAKRQEASNAPFLIKWYRWLRED
jgi:TolA-binding protein